jgi:APA family basic amino acid/polyamine antiporter
MVSFMSLLRTKPITSNTNSNLRRCLTATDLTLMGIGAIIGAGVFVVTGIAAATKGGPAISISYVLAGLASLFAALAYAELAASVGGCGSAYNYAYASFGEIIAWLIGWALLLEYTVGVSSVAIGWAGYMNDALTAMHIGIPHAYVTNPSEGGHINLLAMIMIVILTGLLCMGVKQSARFNSIIVLIKLIAIAIFIGVAISNVHTQNWHPFAPFGWHGIAQGAAIVFYAYIGFDAVSTAAEETINPQRNLPIGIVSSVFICTIIYVAVAILLTGITHYSTLNNASPVANSLLLIGYPLAASLISIGAIAGLTTVMLVLFYGLTRILFAMSRDGLLPAFFSKLHARTQTPIPLIMGSGLIIALIAGFVPLSEAASLVNIGTLTAFTLVCSGVVAMRLMHPDLPRPFKLPLHPIIPFLGIVFCIYLMMNLSSMTWKFFLGWLVIGTVVYFIYSRKNSVLNQTV